MIATTQDIGWSPEQIDQRLLEIDRAREGLRIAADHFSP